MMIRKVFNRTRFGYKRLSCTVLNNRQNLGYPSGNVLSNRPSLGYPSCNIGVIMWFKTKISISTEDLQLITQRNQTEGEHKPFDFEEEYVLRKLVLLSPKHYLCDSKLRFILNGILCYSNLLMEGKMVARIVQEVVVPNAWRTTEDEDILQSGDLRMFSSRDKEELSRRGLAHQILRALVGLEDEMIIQISRSEVYSLLKNPSMLKWQKFECGLGLLVCLVQSSNNIYIQAFEEKNLIIRRVLGPWYAEPDDIGLLMMKTASLRLITESTIHFPCSFSFSWADMMLKFTRYNMEVNSNIIVQSYAATCAMNILAAMKFRSKDLEDYDLFAAREPDLKRLLASLFKAMEAPGSEDNETFMMCVCVILKVCGFDLRTSQDYFNYLLRLYYCKDTENQDFSTCAAKSVVVLLRRIGYLSTDLLEDRFNQVLLVFEDLISSPRTEERGFRLINAVFEILDYSTVQPYVEDVWTAMFSMGIEEVRFTQSVVTVMSNFLLKHGAQSLVDTVNCVGPNVFNSFLAEWWIPTLQVISGAEEFELATIAGTKLLCESDFFLVDLAGEKTWGQLLEMILTLISDRAKEISEGEDDPVHYLCESLARASSKLPGKYTKMIEENLTEDNKTFLLKLCHHYNTEIV